MNALKDPAIRALRTFLQTFLGVYLAGILGAEVTVLNDFADVGLLNSAAAAGIVATLTLIQNFLEESRTVSYERG